MTDTCTVRHPRTDEIPALKHLWDVVFGSDGMDAFFLKLFRVDLCIAVYIGNTLTAAGYLIPAGNLVSHGHFVPCVMIYAVATYPEYRGRGYGEAVVRGLTETGIESGFPAIVLCPSEDSLFEYYSTRSSMRDWFFCDEYSISFDPDFECDMKLSVVSINEYITLRRKLLANISYIDSPGSIFEYQKILCIQLGGGLFRLDSPAGPFCIVAERQSEETVYIKEFLSPPGYTDADKHAALRAVAYELPAACYVIRSPVSGHSGFTVSSANSYDNSTCSSDVNISKLNISNLTRRRFGMLSLKGSALISVNDSEYLPWYGLAFD